MSAPDSNPASMALPVSRSGSDLKVTPETPWLGLRSFTEEVRNYFFGRDSEIQDLYERVLHRPLTVLFGQSGLGKTSLLRAGLIPRLRENCYLPILIRLVHDADAEPLEHQVVREISGVIPSIHVSPESFPSLWQLFHDPEFGFVGSPQAESLRPVLIFDQFEELFTLGEAKRPDDARAFLESLACLVENRPPASIRQAIEQDDALADRLLLSLQPCKILLTLRDDFLHRLERCRRQMPSMMENRLELRLLSGPQAFRAVYEPGAKRTATPIVSYDTARGIVRFVAGVAAETVLEDIENVPPLLSLICEQLNAHRLAQQQDTIQSEALEQTAPEVLREFYTGSFADHPPAVRDFIENELVSESGFRESVTLDTAVADLRRAGVPDPETVLRGLVDQRLLIIEERGGISRVEFTHDILAPIAAASRAEGVERRLTERLHRQRYLRPALVIVLLALGPLTWLAWEFNGRSQGQRLVAQIVSSVPWELPRLIDQDLPGYRRWADPLLQDALETGDINEVNAESVTPSMNDDSSGFRRTRRAGFARSDSIRLHASLALLDVDDSQTEYLAKRLLDCTFGEFPIIRERLEKSSARSDRLQQDLWPVFRGTDRAVARTSEDQVTTLKARLRAGMALARWSTPDAWTEREDLHFLAERLTAENPIHQAVLLDELRPLATKLSPLLDARFRDASLRETERVAAAQALLDYAAADVQRIAALLLNAEPAQYEILFPLALQNRDKILPNFQRIAAQEPDARLTDVERIRLGKERAGAAVSLIRLNDNLHATAALQVRDDPEAVTQFAHRQRPRGVTPYQLLDALETASAPAAAVSRSSPTVRFGLLISLGEFPFEDIPESRREKLVATLDDWYRHDPRSAIHGAVGWLLRTWGQTEVVTEVDRTPLAPDPTGRRDWFVDVVRGETEGQSFEDSFTFVVFPAGEFEMGSPDSENARSDDERLHHVRLTRPIAVCDRELTVGQWQNFERATGRKVKLDDKKSPTPAHPMNFVNWYGAVRYCHWLTTTAGGIEDVQCYDLPDAGKPDSDLDDRPFHLERSGYRLPTEAEWEYASRSGLRSSYGFGSDRALLPLYANYLDTSNDSTRIGGSLRPNGRGVFDMHGNILEWCHDWYKKDDAITDEPAPRSPAAWRKNRVLRGGSWSSAGRDCRSADRHDYSPGFEGHRVGFRLVKVPGSPIANHK